LTVEAVGQELSVEINTADLEEIKAPAVYASYVIAVVCF